MNACDSVVRLSVCSALVILAGCFTVRETDHLQVAVGALPSGKEPRVQVVGFDASFTTYDTAYTYGTATGFGGGCCSGRRGCYPGFFSSHYSALTYVPRHEVTAAFRDRATELLERAGCIVQTQTPQYRIEVRFDGPFAEEGDGWAEVGWLVCTVLTADFQAQGWEAKLKIHDLSTGKLLFEKSLFERDEAVVWGPIPLISPSCSVRTAPYAMKEKCLLSLTDRAIAEAITFLSGK